MKDTTRRGPLLVGALAVALTLGALCPRSLLAAGDVRPTPAAHPRARRDAPTALMRGAPLDGAVARGPVPRRAISAVSPVVGGPSAAGCRRLPAGRRVLKLNLKPDTDLVDLVSWISSITCRQFVIPGSISESGRKITVVSPDLITPEEAYRLFLEALDSMGLTVQPFGEVLKVIEIPSAKTSAIPFYGEDPGDTP